VVVLLLLLLLLFVVSFCCQGDAASEQRGVWADAAGCQGL
jgi:hypothetical protein